jgi:hypothetical protein
MFGRIVDEDEEEGTVTVEIAPGTQVKMVRAGIARRITEDDFEDDEDDDDTDEEVAQKHDDGPDENAAGPIRS